MLKILEKGKNIKHHDFYVHRCGECKAKFIYDVKKDIDINGILDLRRVIKCPNCNNYDLVENIFGLLDKKAKSKDLIKADLVEKVDQEVL